jgi:hypothetical protein
VATTAMVDAYVRQLLLEEHGDELVELEDGHYQVPAPGDVRLWVVHGNPRTRRVLVTARLLEDVAAAPELLEELNGLNAVTPYGRYFWMDGDVFVEETVLAEDLEPSTLFSAIGFVVWAAENAGLHLAGFDGSEPVAGTSGPAAPVGADLTDRTAPLAGSRPAPEPTGSPNAVNVGGYL